ncbi:nucleolar and coiled-body phosphoprotein 1-like isoform X1 [Tripterygium wilfordii]|uniref:nucleolar and coiled-body phosphoprotein 1-like isoform X1 n=1 Tax=Tripterygium wilfordii TaxID=458696 RepID=UPI0018F8134A|nr:nucleolar and coiled-body phosphoprotein 1-like isoform X1 [Tripterygium wilfordii]
MVGGGSRRDESVVLNSTNVFAALGSLRKKKKNSDKEGTSKSKDKKGAASSEKEPAKEVFWAPAPLTVKSWADVDDEDDDDYYATTAPPASVWGDTDTKANEETSEPVVEESESEEDLEEADDDVDEEHEHEPEAPVEVEPVVKKPTEAPLVHKDTDRQLSKKELKKKELEELEAVLAELGLQKNANAQDEPHVGTAQNKKADIDGEMEKKENSPGESKTSKKKKKKDKSSKEPKESENQPDDKDVGNGTDDAAGTEKAEDTSAPDVKDRLKKLASSKKKKSSKEMDAAARAAASEAAARNARLAAAKKKEKNHYNQQPVR